ncbi:PDR/VanB family oxidoreductase [Leekyejoonella antrihumi]|uniref:Oxidoreductase n=1 Tax=Leekyejoonella antrihumi TaxID=1660198 RepID=A0A563E7R8_9MICO|nr:PDR/VanB family oxidoreductase [Leekyejoonella antrihumi]TWP38557.1 oxidoreductase [Leekyejoonella antrihumi]
MTASTPLLSQQASVSTSAEVELDLVVEKADQPADGVLELVLRAPSGSDLPAWAPGAHIDVVAGGFTRQYSLCGDPHDRSVWRIAVLREVAGRGGSAHLHDQVRQGDTVRVRGPRNHFALVASPQYLFIAGGIGVTPILPMAAAAESAGSTWSLAYGGRTRATMAYADELRTTYGEKVSLHPQDETGPLPLEMLLGEARTDTAVYCCGPEGLLQAVEQHCAAWPSGALHLERFSPKQQGKPQLQGDFEVELASTGQTLTVPPERSILSVLEEAGVGILSSCTEGTCGTCETGVLSGQVDHRDSLLTADERAANDVMFVCVSRAACPRLVLDL